MPVCQSDILNKTLIGLETYFAGFDKARTLMTIGGGNSGIVLLDLLRKTKNLDNLDFYFLDTGKHFPETLELIDRLEQVFGIVIFRLKSNSLASPKMPRKCCYERKVLPLEKVLNHYDCWISAIRRDQTPSRKNLKKYEDDLRLRGGIKFSPMLEWDSEMIWDQMRDNELPYNSLLDRGYTSIGCEPCTSISSNPDNERSGRWAGTDNQGGECGIHDQDRK